jgi:hypothetical protein
MAIDDEPDFLVQLNGINCGAVGIFRLRIWCKTDERYPSYCCCCCSWYCHRHRTQEVICFFGPFIGAISLSEFITPLKFSVKITISWLENRRRRLRLTVLGDKIPSSALRHREVNWFFVVYFG